MQPSFLFPKGTKGVCWCHVGDRFCKIEQHGNRVDLLRQDTQPLGEYDTFVFQTVRECNEQLEKHGFRSNDVLVCLYMFGSMNVS